ncbi:Retrovirus-related Pol polyprotein from transposon TNT 1-94 [Senna tora]|uniref:Retrovirus-related Pol polyprotein from transposon TNT 1-94 n=1 Tax=Senna tora TaxID=362788 RepID=A0A834TIF1_9FABA|nr:Retrovirus-related Pol polyprotein from transposon TNT 1-94 [Senna tora]
MASNAQFATWIIDSGVNRHMTGSSKGFSNYSSCSNGENVRIADGSDLHTRRRIGSGRLRDGLYVLDIVQDSGQACLGVSKDAHQEIIEWNRRRNLDDKPEEAIMQSAEPADSSPIGELPTFPNDSDMPIAHRKGVSNIELNPRSDSKECYKAITLTSEKEMKGNPGTEEVDKEPVEEATITEECFEVCLVNDVVDNLANDDELNYHPFEPSKSLLSFNAKWDTNDFVTNSPSLVQCQNFMVTKLLHLLSYKFLAHPVGGADTYFYNTPLPLFVPIDPG